MVIAYHVGFGPYGVWLPNDDRGSNSEFVRKAELLPYGLATKVHHHRSVAHLPTDRNRRREMRSKLDFPPVTFTGRQAQSIATGFAIAVARSNFQIVACAILPNHVHLVVMRHKFKIEQVVNLLKGAATRQLLTDGRHPLMEYRTKDGSTPSPWERNCDRVYLFNPEDVKRSIRYDEQNPIRAGFKPQRWSFVVPYAG